MIGVTVAIGAAFGPAWIDTSASIVSTVGSNGVMSAGGAAGAGAGGGAGGFGLRTPGDPLSGSPRGGAFGAL